VFPVKRELAGNQPLPSIEASWRSLRRAWACHTQRQHPDLTDMRTSPQKLTPVALPPGVSAFLAHLASRFEGLNRRV
jgi:hypothetical protein